MQEKTQMASFFDATDSVQLTNTWQKITSIMLRHDLSMILKPIKIQANQ